MWHFDRKFHHRAASHFGLHVLFVLLIGQQVLNDVLQLVLTQYTTRFHIAHNLLQIAHARGQVLHFTQTFMHRLESIAHMLERLAQALFQRIIQLLIDRFAHLFQFPFVALLHFRNGLLQAVAQIADLLTHRIILLALTPLKSGKRLPHPLFIVLKCLIHPLLERL